MEDFKHVFIKIITMPSSEKNPLQWNDFVEGDGNIWSLL